MIIGRCSGWLDLVLAHTEGICRNFKSNFYQKHRFLPDVPFLMCWFQRSDLGTKLPPTPPPQLMQEVHNMWRQTQEAGRAVVLRSYFSYPLLPSQVRAAVNYVSYWTAPEKQQEAGTPPILRKQPIQPFSFCYLWTYTCVSTSQGVINASSEALFKDNHCFLSGPPPRPLPSYLSPCSSSHAFICVSLGARYRLSFKWSSNSKLLYGPERKKKSPADNLFL